MAIEQTCLGLKWVKDTRKAQSCNAVVYFGVELFKRYLNVRVGEKIWRRNVKTGQVNKNILYEKVGGI